MVEKYNVMGSKSKNGGLGGGGEYVLQDGFGWTNGVYIALKKQLDS
jgi:alpha,alpha-trehalase